jgi:hypothetical protein
MIYAYEKMPMPNIYNFYFLINETDTTIELNAIKVVMNEINEKKLVLHGLKELNQIKQEKQNKTVKIFGV